MSSDQIHERLAEVRAAATGLPQLTDEEVWDLLEIACDSLAFVPSADLPFRQQHAARKDLVEKVVARNFDRTPRRIRARFRRDDV